METAITKTEMEAGRRKRIEEIFLDAMRKFKNEGEIAIVRSIAVTAGKWVNNGRPLSVLMPKIYKY
jgi:hypothetical protein